jgi:hypothetical protein
MELTQQEIWNIFLNSIMEENNVSIKSIYECMETNKDEIDVMDTLFDSDDDMSIRKRLVLLHLISQDRAKENMAYYINNVENSGEVSIASDIEKYKTLLITSLIFNLDFFIMACNWCGLIQADVERERLSELNNSEVKTPPVSTGIIIFVIPSRIYAAPADHELKFIDDYYVDDVFGLYCGNFEFYGNMEDQRFEARFQFKDKETGKPLDAAPCYIDIEVVSNADNSPCIIHLDRRMRSKPSTVRSDEVYINYSKGFTVKVLPGKLNG